MKRPTERQRQLLMAEIRRAPANSDLWYYGGRPDAFPRGWEEMSYDDVRALISMARELRRPRPAPLATASGAEETSS